MIKIIQMEPEKLQHGYFEGIKKAHQTILGIVLYRDQLSDIFDLNISARFAELTKYWSPLFIQGVPELSDHAGLLQQLEAVGCGVPE